VPRPLEWHRLHPVARAWLIAQVVLNSAPFTWIGVSIAASFSEVQSDGHVIVWGSALLLLAFACVNLRTLLFETVTDRAVARQLVVMRTPGGTWIIPNHRIAAIRCTPWLRLRGILIAGRWLELKEPPRRILQEGCSSAKVCSRPFRSRGGGKFGRRVSKPVG